MKNRGRFVSHNNIYFFPKKQKQNNQNKVTYYLKHHLETARDPSAIVSFDYKDDKTHF